MANKWKVEEGEISKRPIGFRQLGPSPFCEGAEPNKKSPKKALFTQETSVFGFVCSTKQKRAWNEPKPLCRSQPSFVLFTIIYILIR